MNLLLIPVIEFEPSNLGVTNFCELQERGLWSAYWDSVLAATDLRPIRPGSWLVATSEFHARGAFELLVRVHLISDAILSSSSIPVVDEISPIPGGYALNVDGSVQIEPGCCCDLSDLESWSSAFREGVGPTLLNIGHGCFSLSSDGAVTTITRRSEVVGHEDDTFQYPASAFARALEQADVERKRFAESLKSYVSQFALSEELDQVVNRLIFGL